MLKINKFVPNTFLLLFIFSLFIALYSNSHVYATESFWDFSDIKNMESYKMLTDNSSNTYIIGATGKTVVINQITSDNDCNKINLSLNQKYIDCVSINSCVYFLSQISNISTPCLEITMYNFIDNSISSFQIDNISTSGKYSFAVNSNGNMYFLDNRYHSTVSCYNSNGSYIYRTTLPEAINQLFTSTNGETVFAATNDRIFSSSSNDSTFTTFLSQKLQSPIYVTQDDIFVDYNGTAVSSENDFPTFTTSISSSNTNVGIAKNYFCRTANGKIYGYNKYNGKQVLLYTLDEPQDYMCSVDNKIILFSVNSCICTTIDKGDLSYPQPATAPPSSSQSGNSSANNSSSNNNSITSDVYYIDNDSFMIKNVKSGTTIAQFKSKLKYSSLSVAFTNYENTVVTSGNLGTGATASFIKNGSIIAKYTIIVTGDLTGEGNVNSRDTKALSAYLLGKSSLSPYFLEAADCNLNGNVDTVDLLKISKKSI